MNHTLSPVVTPVFSGRVIRDAHNCSYIADQSTTADADEQLFELTVHSIACAVNTNIDVDDGEPCIDAVVEVTVNDQNQQVTLTFQTCNGRFETQNGCLVLGTDGTELTALEDAVYAAVHDELIESVHRTADSVLDGMYAYHETGFRCQLNNCDLLLRERIQQGDVELVLYDNSYNSVCDYGQAIVKLKSFHALDSARQWLDQYRTSDYHDFSGMQAAIQAASQPL